LLQSLSSIGQLSSSSGLFSDNLLSLSSVSLNILLDGSDVSGDLINLFLNLRFLSNSNNLKGSLELLSLSNKSVGLINFLFNFFSNISNLLCCRLNGGLQFSSLRGKSFNLGSDGSFSIFKVSLLLLDNSGELLLSFLGSGVNLFTGLFTLFFILLDLSDDGLLSLLNLLDKVSNLLLSGGDLILDNRLLIFLSLNLLLNDADLFISFLGDSGSLRFNELGLVDLRNFFLVNGLGLFLRNDALSLFLKNSLFLSLLLFNGRLLNGNLSNELRGFHSQVSTHLLVLLLLSWVLRFLSSSAGCLTLDLLLFSNHLFLFVDFLKLGEFLSNHSFTLRDFSCKGLLGISRAIVVADLARC